MRKLFFIGLVFFLMEIGIALHLSSLPVVHKNKVSTLPSSDYVKYVSGTFRPLLAHAFFMKGVVELAKNSSQKMDYLFGLFQTVLELDPEFYTAAFLGGVVLPVSPEDIQRGIEFLKVARKINPHQWRIPYWIGFNYVQLEDYKKAAEFYKEASKIPYSPSFLKTNLAMLYFKAHTPEQALVYYEGLKESLDDPRTHAMIEAKIDWLRNILGLDERVQYFHRTFGKWPSDLKDLVEKGLVKEIPSDTLGLGFCLERTNASGSEEVRVGSLFY